MDQESEIISDETTRPGVSDFGSVDPAPPYPKSEVNVERHAAVLHNPDEKMFERMRALFSLRNIGGKHAVQALCDAFVDKSALLRHEIAYVLGQMQDSHAVSTLEKHLSDVNEHLMVRHEAAEALGAIGEPSSMAILTKFLHDPNPEISESCEVALDLLSLCNSADAKSVEW